MDSKKFNTITNNRIEKCLDVLVRKSEEYSPDTDKLHNFKAASGMLGISQAEALWGMAAKHIISISDMVKNSKNYSLEVWEEKIGDALNYLLLLNAIVEEENES